MTVPCVIARPLEAAERMLGEAGVTAVEVTRTGPPRRPLSGPLRVIRQRAAPGGVELVVAGSAPLPETEACYD